MFYTIIIQLHNLLSIAKANRFQTETVCFFILVLFQGLFSTVTVYTIIYFLNVFCNRRCLYQSRTFCCRSGTTRQKIRKKSSVAEFIVVRIRHIFIIEKGFVILAPFIFSCLAHFFQPPQIFCAPSSFLLKKFFQKKK